MKFIKKTSQNGLRVIVAPMQNTETFTILVLIGTGANYETKRTNGLSHFLEHMFFKGTKKYPKPLMLDKKLDAIGAEHNAFTSREETGYWIKADTKHFDLGLEFVSEILQNALLKEEEINKERGVIIEEMRMILDMPGRYVWSVFEELIYGNTPHGWDAIGTENNILNMRRSHFLSYWKSQYVAQNAIVIVAGNVEVKEAQEKIEKAYNKLRRGKFSKEPKIKAVTPGPRVKIYDKNTDQSHVMIGSVGYPIEHKQRYIADMVATIMGGYMSSRLFMDIREKRGLAYTVHASHQSYKQTGYFASYAGVPHKKVDEVLRRIIYNMERMKKSFVTSEELTRAKENIRGKMAISLESTDEVASFLGMQEILLGKIRKPDDIMRRVDKITKNDIKRVAQSLFNARNVYCALVGPHGGREAELTKLIGIL